ncbi:MAG: HEAT repeat domain-containing protein [Nitrospiraceae bacterium]|nr:MAG: HEAT repeat domain-containing protein [Nitrospiraceae bacterium]
MDNQQDADEMIKMIVDHMENGFLENIVDLFKHDKSYFPFIGTMLGDERMGVRIGTMALVETLKTQDLENVLIAVPGIARLLKDQSPNIRGDAAYLLGIIGHENGLPYLNEALNDEDLLVRETVEEAISAIKEADA